jgi:hypothetical protein
LVAGKTYALYLYAQNGGHGSSVTTYTIGSVSKTVMNPGSDPGRFINEQNYVVLTGVADANGTISCSVDAPDIYMAFNGLQLVRKPSGTVITLF